MDVKLINPFLESFNTIMPQLGFQTEKGEILLKDKINGAGIAITVGITGDIKGNVIYIMEEEGAKKVASQMMMGMPVDELNDMAQSAISELSNMLTANASMNYSNQGLTTDISTPVLVMGKDINIKVNTKEIICINMIANDITIAINISIE
ncbi:chemotaxis protein, CheC-like protein [Gottschalkia acidurici 9a]|uniref:Chemotaxis protein, CheC-like protein n=1 Tax=Gottschalkia acidurici (strain ATCC 7906 / DSM 604 / BCRC 14475 / CIP 104303 / KCTC 5404 / NCIMB 10678 / 9a) TaxID=1128398 RepID=K0B1U2_GOTA9|nr:chemotaxis protein CheX [Gottschalkia acidurici]AFS79424.1 chemotaxis protein, CheC-like protein [Gottschalkia acidurici 9a]